MRDNDWINLPKGDNWGSIMKQQGYQWGGKQETTCGYNSHIIQIKDKLENAGYLVCIKSVLNSLDSTIPRQMPKSISGFIFSLFLSSMMSLTKEKQYVYQ